MRHYSLRFSRILARDLTEPSRPFPDYRRAAVIFQVLRLSTTGRMEAGALDRFYNLEGDGFSRPPDDAARPTRRQLGGRQGVRAAEHELMCRLSKLIACLD
jgi:hypothetical protein